MTRTRQKCSHLAWVNLFAMSAQSIGYSVGLIIKRFKVQFLLQQLQADRWSASSTNDQLCPKTNILFFQDHQPPVVPQSALLLTGVILVVEGRMISYICCIKTQVHLNIDSLICIGPNHIYCLHQKSVDGVVYFFCKLYAMPVWFNCPIGKVYKSSMCSGSFLFQKCRRYPDLISQLLYSVSLLDLEFFGIHENDPQLCPYQFYVMNSAVKFDLWLAYTVY